jgi:exonuclease SbcC
LSGFEAISKETILALEIEVVEGGTELQKKNRVGVGRTPTTDYIKVNFEDLEKRKPAFDFN